MNEPTDFILLGPTEPGGWFAAYFPFWDYLGEVYAMDGVYHVSVYDRQMLRDLGTDVSLTMVEDAEDELPERFVVFAKVARCFWRAPDKGVSPDRAEAHAYTRADVTPDSNLRRVIARRQVKLIPV